jgi:hypothetical protein
MLRDRDERSSIEILRRIRSGHKPDVVLQHINTSDVAIAVPEPSRFAMEAFLVNLVHSTGSLQEILNLAVSTLDPFTDIRLPESHAFLPLCNRIVQLPVMNSLLQRKEHPGSGPVALPHEASYNVHPRSSISTRSAPVASDETDENKDERPPHWVPASPWTSITDSNEAVSHLVSVYFAWINPTWRFVEQDLFLQGEALV